MAVLRSVLSYILLFMWFTIVLSKLQLSDLNANLTSSSRRTYKPVAIDWRSKALGKYSNSDNSTLKRRECWIMKMGPEDDYTQDVVECTDKKAPTLTQLIAHGRNLTEFGKADKAHTPIFYTDWKNPALGAAGGLPGTNPSEKILWYINRSFNGYVSPNAGCQGGLVLNMKIYTYSDMVRDSWYVSSCEHSGKSTSTDILLARANGGDGSQSGGLSRLCLSGVWIQSTNDLDVVLLSSTRTCCYT